MYIARVSGLLIYYHITISSLHHACKLTVPPTCVVYSRSSSKYWFQPTDAAVSLPSRSWQRVSLTNCTLSGPSCTWLMTWSVSVLEAGVAAFCSAVFTAVINVGEYTSNTEADSLTTNMKVSYGCCVAYIDNGVVVYSRHGV